LKEKVEICVGRLNDPELPQRKHALQ